MVAALVALPALLPSVASAQETTTTTEFPASTSTTAAPTTTAPPPSSPEESWSSGAHIGLAGTVVVVLCLQLLALVAVALNTGRISDN